MASDKSKKAGGFGRRPSDKKQIEEGLAFAPQFSRAGLIPAIVTDASSGAVLMFAHMNAEALALTIKTGEAYFWSRSRKALWRKGETSGNVLRVIEIRTDCDQDVIWLKASLDGVAACHTGKISCFYRTIVTNGSGSISLQFSEDA